MSLSLGVNALIIGFRCLCYYIINELLLTM
eukprot:COSAG06_NODE_39714_length_409_cov_1.332258_1_plen_29_part_10